MILLAPAQPAKTKTEFITGISNRSLMPSCCAFATSFHARHANQLGGDRHVRRILSRKEPASSEPPRSAITCRIGARLEEEGSGALLVTRYTALSFGASTNAHIANGSISRGRFPIRLKTSLKLQDDDV